MNLQEDPIAIISSACRLPLGVTNPSQLWDVFCGNVNSKDVFSSPESVPDTRHSDPRAFINPARVGGAGWLGKEGVEFFDPAFFNISPAEAEVLRPNTRLSLELTWEALEKAGIPPASLRGQNVAVSIGVGTEDGWDLRRFSDDDTRAFDHRWAANSDPSGVSGQVAHFFDFRGPSSVISTACSSGAFALRDGIQALLHEECELAVVGAVTTHFFTAPFDWAASVNVASKKGQCAAFSGEADGYVPSEGAVFFVLKKASTVPLSTVPILGIIRSLATGHNGATRALATPNVSAQVSVTRRSLHAANLSPSEISILEAHGTGTRLGDAMEAEAFRSVYDTDEQRCEPLWVSSSKTLFGHCQAASIFVGILKVLASFERKALPPHLADPLPEFKQGKILIPTSLTALSRARPIIAQVCSFGFTGSIASLILGEAPYHPSVPSAAVENAIGSQSYFLPFSAKTASALNSQVAAVYEWAVRTECSLYDLGTILSLAREHHSVRLAIVASSLDDLRNVHYETYTGNLDDGPAQEVPSATTFLNISQLLSSVTEEDKTAVHGLLGRKQILQAACLLYKKGHNLQLDEIYDLRNVTKLHQHLQTFPTYAFDRKVCWKTSPPVTKPKDPTMLPRNDNQDLFDTALRPVSIDVVAETVASILHMPIQGISRDSDIFDLGINSLNSIELAKTLSQISGISIPTLELYSLLTIQAIHDYVAEKSQGHSRWMTSNQSRLSQTEVDAWVAKYGASLNISRVPEMKKERSPNAVSVLLTGANGMLGCHVLHGLLSRPEVMGIFCPVRGDAWSRLSQAYTIHGHDDVELIQARHTGRLVVFHVSDLGDDYLGCGPEMYIQLTQIVDTIVHLAWKLDFNIPASSFQNCVESTRNLAQLCIAADKRVAYYFISSFSAYFGYQDTLIPEQILSPDLTACLDQGYAVSKLIAEHALFSMYQKSKDAFNLRIVRVGQICGNSVTGEWSLNEMMPMMIKSLPVLNVIPRNLPDVSWIPSDICAAAIIDFVFPPGSESGLRVLHLANPRIAQWPVAVDILSELAGVHGVSLVSLREYVDTVRSAAGEADLSIARLLPYFSGVVENGDFPSKYASLEVKESLTCSAALAACPEVNEAFLRPIVKFLLATSTLDSKTVSISRSLDAPVLLFGPWSESVSSPMPISKAIKARVESVALQVRQEIQYEDVNEPLDHQLATLIGQVSAYEELRKCDVIPCAVLGYCFGEYAASVCSDILSLETAVDIIMRRAAALRDVKGSMLNVFADVNTVKRNLLKLPFDMEIAIHAGPNHFILSGPPEYIASAQSSFQKAGIKTKLVETSIPFHSAIMDNAIMKLKLPDVARNIGSCTYISGLTGCSIGGQRLGPKYWLRHMRDPVLFVDAVRYAQKHFPSAPLVDVGPGCMLSSIISRYKWDGSQVLTLEKFLNRGFVRTERVIQTPAVSSHTASPGPQTVEWAPQPSPIVTTKSCQTMDREAVDATVSGILVSDFGFKSADPRGLLSKPFLMLGLQSLDFVAFSEKVLEVTGLTLPASSFASDLTLSEILASLTT